MKPENICLDKTYERCKLIDFGLCKDGFCSASSDERSDGGEENQVGYMMGTLFGSEGQVYSAVGTHEYLAPEVVLQVGHDCCVDWYGARPSAGWFCP